MHSRSSEMHPELNWLPLSANEHTSRCPLLTPAALRPGWETRRPQGASSPPPPPHPTRLALLMTLGAQWNPTRTLTVPSLYQRRTPGPKEWLTCPSPSKYICIMFLKGRHILGGKALPEMFMYFQGTCLTLTKLMEAFFFFFFPSTNYTVRLLGIPGRTEISHWSKSICEDDHEFF